MNLHVLYSPLWNTIKPSCESMSTAFAPGKAIIFGEHAVVYGRPAIAVPVKQVQAQADVEPGGTGTGVLLVAPNLNRTCTLSDAPPQDALRAIVESTLTHMQVGVPPDVTITVTSTIPMACGLGSGTAVSVAVARALAGYFGVRLPDEVVSELAFEVERIHHGRPSGIDNTVVAYERPVCYTRGQPVEMLTVGKPFHLILADTGVCAPTRISVGAVYRNWQTDPQRYDSLFDRIAEIAKAARVLIENGDPVELGGLMNENQQLLREIDVSSPELERLIAAALQAGASGAKLSGAGRGGNIIALVSPEVSSSVEEALRNDGAKGILATEVS